MGSNLTDKVAVITGSGQGIGRAIAIHMAEEGAKVVTNNRRPGSTGFAILKDELINSLSVEQKERLIKEAAAATGDAETTAKTIKDTGGVAVPFFGDVSNFEVARNLIQTAIDNFGKIDILVNVVGTFRFSPVWEMSEETWDYVTSIKPKAYFNCIRHALPFMIKQREGRIINCASEGWKGGGLKQVNYSAANAGVIGLTYAVAKEIAQFGITCNAFNPLANTRAIFELTAYDMAVPEEKSPIMGGAPRSGDPIPNAEDIVPFVSYLATEDAGDINGTLFVIDGYRVGIYPEPEAQTNIIKCGSKWSIEELRREVHRGLSRTYRGQPS